MPLGCAVPTVAVLNCSIDADWLALESTCFTSHGIIALKPHKFSEHATFQLMNMLMEIYISDNGDVMCK